MSHDLEFGQIVLDIFRAALAGGDQVDLMREHTAVIQRVRDEAIAAALDAHASFYWEASTLLDPAREAARAGGDEAMEALLTAQIKIMREVSARLRRRAAEISGVSEEEAAARQLLEQPAAAATAAPVDETPEAAAVVEHECCSCCTDGECVCASLPEDARCHCTPCEEKTPAEGDKGGNE